MIIRFHLWICFVIIRDYTCKLISVPKIVCYNDLREKERGSEVMKLPEAFIDKYRHLMGNGEADALFSAMNGQAVSGWRANPLKPAWPELIDQSEPVPGVTNGYYGKVDGHSLDHVSGWVYSQEPSAMNVGEVLDPQPGERVLDLCAAPGGKSTQIVGLMKNKGLLVANEIFRNRAKILAENLERWGATNTLVTNESPDKLEQRFTQFFDRILVDAPCSGEGMFRKEPAGIEYWNPDYPAECANRQRKILNSAMKMLKPGGVLVYSTCTFAPEEDEQNAAWLLKTYPTLTIETVKKVTGMDDGRPEWADGNPELQRAIRIFPHHYRGEGHFIARFRFGADASNLVRRPKKHKRGSKKYMRGSNAVSRDQLQYFDRWIEKMMPHYQANHLVTMGAQLYDLPTGINSIDNVKVIRPGLHLGTLKKHRFEPSLALALASNSNAIKRVLNISLDQWHHYVHGETLTIKDASVGNGWYLLVCQRHSCGFGKLVGTTLKNFYPKGLRF